ncbi:hexa1 [Symbiodinium sp. CCMP2592]|nr:hexa1 [Symbiodinium sp. CCMP2592]
MRLLALLLEVWLLQVQRLHGERAETTDGPGPPGSLVICRDLREPRRILREGRDETANANDIREFLWPMPRTVTLQQQGRHVEDSELSGLQPLRVDPCAMAFNLTGVPEDRAAVLWSLEHFCWRLCTAAEETDSSEADSCRLNGSDGSDGSSGLAGLDVQMEKYQLLFAGVSKLSAASIHGFRRGLETLLQVVDALSGSEGRSWTWAPGFTTNGAIPVDLWIEDVPKFPWRGLLLDTARHFAPTEATDRNELWYFRCSPAASKLNVLHWHVTDAMSFPLQLESLPQLAQLGSFGASKTYSHVDVRHIVALAANLSIRVVPELDMPAHTASWIFGEPETVSNCTHVLPHDPNDAKNRFKARDKLALDISSKRTKKVVSSILKEMAGLFPDEFFHVGGDEVDFRCWTTMPHIAAWMRKKGLGASQALQHFFEHVFQEVKRLGKRPIVWQDAFDQGLRLPKEAVVQPWKCWGSVGKNLPGWPPLEPEAQIGHAAAFAATSQGFATLQSSCWYLDWNSQWTDFYNHTADEGPLSSRPSDRLLGGETALWSELIDFTNLNCRAWPRAAVVADACASKSLLKGHLLPGIL